MESSYWEYEYIFLYENVVYYQTCVQTLALSHARGDNVLWHNSLFARSYFEPVMYVVVAVHPWCSCMSLCI